MCNVSKTQPSDIRIIGDVSKLDDLTIKNAEDFLTSLPKQVEVTFLDGSKALVDVQFDTSIFQGKKRTYELTGSLILPPEYVNAFNRQVSLTVIVENDLKVEEPIDPQDPTIEDDQKGLQANDIAAIVLRIILGLTIIGGLIYFLIIRKKKA